MRDQRKMTGTTDNEGFPFQPGAAPEDVLPEPEIEEGTDDPTPEPDAKTKRRAKKADPA